MRKLAYIVSVLLCSAILAGCAYNDEPKNGEETKTQKHISLTADIAADTRTDITDPQNPVWSDYDEIGVFFVSGGMIESYNDYLTAYSGGATATFEGDVYIDDGEYDLYGYYPWGYFGSSMEDPAQVQIEVPAIQYPTATSFDPLADIMAMKPAAVTLSDEYIDLGGMQFKRMMGMIRIVLTGEGLGGEALESLTFTTDDPTLELTGIAHFDLVEGKFLEFFDNASTEVTARFEDAVYANGQDCIILCVPAVTFPAGTTLTVTGNTGSWMFTKTYAVPANNPVRLGAGGYHTMNITLANSDIEPFTIPVTHINLAPSSLDLVEGNTGKFNATVMPTNASNRDVTWDSNNKNVATVDQTGLVTAVGEGTAIITVQSSADNSKTASGIVTVRAASSLQWARSNIVWIADSNEPGGGRLTFAVTPADNATMAANVSGVYFQWGSLLALSPAGATYAESDIIFSPTGTNNYTWASIPSLNGYNTAPFDNNVNAEDDFAVYNGGTGYDETAGTGDICRYISAKGWVEGNWRMPTTTNLTDLNTQGTATWSGGFPNLTVNPGNGNEYGFYQVSSGYFLGEGATASGDKTNPATGVAFPMAGSRSNSNGSKSGIGQTGSYWAGSSNAANASAFDFFGAYGGSVMSFPRKSGLSVRCVRDM